MENPNPYITVCQMPCSLRIHFNRECCQRDDIPLFIRNINNKRSAILIPHRGTVISYNPLVPNFVKVHTSTGIEVSFAYTIYLENELKEMHTFLTSSPEQLDIITRLVRSFIFEDCVVASGLNTRVEDLHDACILYIKRKEISSVVLHVGLNYLFLRELNYLHHTLCETGAIFHGIGIKERNFPNDTHVYPQRIIEGSGGYIYFVRTKGAKTNPFLCKIGRTGYLKQRLSSLQTSSQEILEYMDYVRVDRNVSLVEREIHLGLKHLWDKGEWFLVTEDQIKEICAWIATRKLSLEIPIVTACHKEI